MAECHDSTDLVLTGSATKQAGQGMFRSPDGRECFKVEYEFEITQPGKFERLEGFVSSIWPVSARSALSCDGGYSIPLGPAIAVVYR